MLITFSTYMFHRAIVQCCQHSDRLSIDELLSHPLLLARFFPARPDNTLTRPLQPSTNDSGRAAREAELQAREQRVSQQETELEKRAAELDGEYVQGAARILGHCVSNCCLCTLPVASANSERVQNSFVVRVLNKFVVKLRL